VRTLSAGGVLRDGAPRADGFFVEKNRQKNNSAMLFLVKKTVILTMKYGQRA
jgi:hypothetical protein